MLKVNLPFLVVWDCCLLDLSSALLLLYFCILPCLISQINIYLLPSLLELPISKALVFSYGPLRIRLHVSFSAFIVAFPSTKAVAWLLPSLPGPHYSFGAFFFSEPCLIPFPECDHPLMTNLCLDPQTPCLSWVAYSWLQVALQVGMSRPDPSPRMSLNSTVAVTARCICITEKSITFLLGFNL